MAEILAVVASGMSVASLSIQVASSVNKLKYFCDRVKDTPSEVHDTLDDIETLSIVIDEIEAIARSGGHLPESLYAALLRSARRCLEASNALRSIVSEIEAALQKHKLRGAVKGALKKTKLDEIRQRLESAKMTCVLAGQSHLRQQNENISTSVLLLQQSVHTSFEPSSIQSENLPAPSIECSTAETTQGNLVLTIPRYSSSDGDEYFWGFYQVHHITTPSRCRIQGDKAKEIPREETQILVSAQLPQWLFRRRFDLYTSQTHSGWNFSLNIYNVRPRKSPIFRHVRDGNISAIERLFQDKTASPFDVNEDGFSLLHVGGSNTSSSPSILTKCKYAISSTKFQLQTLKFLLECGASVHVRNNWGYSPLLHLIEWGQKVCFKQSQSDEFRDAMQCLLDYGSCPYTEQTYSGFTSVELYSGSIEGQRTLLKSLPLEALSSEDFDVLKTLETMADWWRSNLLQLIRNLLPNRKLEPITGEKKQTRLLNISMKYLCDPEDGWLVFMKELLNAGADVHGHRRADSVFATPFWHLLYASGSILSFSTIHDQRDVQTIDDTLTSWLGILEECGYPISDYLAEEERLRDLYDQTLPDTLARVEINACTKEVIIEREWAYLWKEFDPTPPAGIWDWQLNIPERCPDTYRLEAFWRCVEDLETAEPFRRPLEMPGSWED